MAVNDIHRVAAQFSMEGQMCFITRHYRVAQVGSSGNPDAVLCSEFKKFIEQPGGPGTSLLLNASNALNAMFIHSQRVAPTPGGVFTTTMTGAGQGTGAYYPSTVAVVVSLFSDLAGKSGRGRIYIPGIDETDCLGSSLTATGLLNWSLFADQLVTLIVDATAPTPWQLSPVIFSEKRFNAAQVPYYGTVTTRLVRTVLGTQRRRRIGTGI